MSGAGKLFASIGVATMVFALLTWMVADLTAQCRVWHIVVERDGMTPETIRQRPYGCSPAEEKAR